MTETEAPRFLFTRRADVERSHNYLLAGILTLDIPRSFIPPARRCQQAINEIVCFLVAAAQTGALPADGATLGGTWPAGADDDTVAMGAWVERSLTVQLYAELDERGHVCGHVRVLDDDDDEDDEPTLH